MKKKGTTYCTFTTMSPEFSKKKKKNDLKYLKARILFLK